jgi:hypothetical protein
MSLSVRVICGRNSGIIHDGLSGVFRGKKCYRPAQELGIGKAKPKCYHLAQERHYRAPAFSQVSEMLQARARTPEVVGGHSLRMGCRVRVAD